MLEVTDAVISVWGADRVGMHLVPRGDAHDMGDSNLLATFTYVAEQLNVILLLSVLEKRCVMTGLHQY